MKKIYMLTFLGILAIIVLVWAINYLSTGKIVVMTDNKNNTITLQKISGDKSFVKIGMGSLSTTIGHGRYTATVQNGSKTSVQVIDFKKGHKSFHYSISLTDLLKVEPVLHQNAQDIVTDRNGVIYLDNSSGTLYKITQKNSVTELGSGYRFRTVKWANSSFGVGQDKDGYLYAINNGSINQIDMPFANNGKPINFDVTPNKKIYVSYGADIYAGSQKEKFKKIYSATSSNPVLSASQNKVAVADTKYGKNSSTIDEPRLSIIDAAGEEVKTVSVEAERQTWSPNGQYLTSVNETNPVIYDSSLNKITFIPTNSVVSQITWLNSRSLLYTTNNELWLYNLSNQRLSLIAKTLSDNPLTSLSVNRNESHAYVVTFDSISNNFALQKIELKV